MRLSKERPEEREKTEKPEYDVGDERIMPVTIFPYFLIVLSVSSEWGC